MPPASPFLATGSVWPRVERELRRGGLLDADAAAHAAQQGKPPPPLFPNPLNWLRPPHMSA
eukprot:1867168-Pleurochrysis_carterae.AAC.1